jgi:Fis family transcriptional regulator
MKDTGKRRGPLGLCVKGALEKYFHDLNGERPDDLYDLVIGEVERPLLEAVMRHARNNQSDAARMLGINRNTLRTKLKNHGLDPGR